MCTFKEIPDYLKALLAEAHVMIVNGLLTVVILTVTIPLPFTLGQKRSSVGQLASEFGTCSTLKLTFG